MCEEVLDFLDDLEKMYKVFGKRGIETDYFEILSFFAEIIEIRLNMEYDKILIPAHKRISNRLGGNITKEGVIREFMKIPYQDVDYSFDSISRLLNKFNLEYEKEEVEQLIHEMKEELDLEEFERNFGSSNKIDIGDFTKLEGHEFEEYLKTLFKLLGYTVIRTPLVGDQGADLIMSKNGEKTVVQAKKYNGKVSNSAIQEIVAAKNHYKADKAIVVTNSSFTKSAIDLALTNNVELWDGLKLKNIIKNLKTNNKERGLIYEKSVKLEKGKHIQKIRGTCPFCEEEFNFEVDIREGINIDLKCPHCSSLIKAYTESKIWRCEYCSEHFDTKAEAEKHEKICKKRKE
jgi:restriction system protein